MPIEICNALSANCFPDWDGISALATGAAAATALLLPTWQRAKDDKAKRKSLGYSLLLKMVKVHSDLFKLRQHVFEQRAFAREHGEHPDTWRFFRAYATTPSEVVFSSDEMAMLFSLKNYDLFNDVLSLDEAHRSDFGLMREYGSKREALMQMFPAGKMDGLVSGSSIDRETFRKVAPYMAQIDQLLADMIDLFLTHSKDAHNAILGLQEVLKKDLDLSVSLELPALPDDKELPPTTA